MKQAGGLCARTQGFCAHVPCGPSPALDAWLVSRKDRVSQEDIGSASRSGIVFHLIALFAKSHKGPSRKANFRNTPCPHIGNGGFPIANRTWTPIRCCMPVFSPDYPRRRSSRPAN